MSRQTLEANLGLYLISIQKAELRSQKDNVFELNTTVATHKKGCS